MNHTLVSYCDCCGLSVDPLTTENCPHCYYPVDPNKEDFFLQSSIHDLQRVSKYGGGNLKVDELVRRYQFRLNVVHHLKPSISLSISTGSVEAQTSVAPIVATPSSQNVLEETVVKSFPARSPEMPQPEPAIAPPSTGPQAPRRVFSWREFFADQAINIVASVGAFLLLIGSLSFTVTSTNLFVSFLLVFIVHAVFGMTGFVTYRCKTFRIVASIYTIIFALLIPLVGYSAFRLLSGNHIEFSVPVLVAISATYAATIYILMAIYQRFITFAYLGMIALLVTDLAISDALNLAYWWWPSMAMILAIAATISLKRPGGRAWPFIDRWEVLREPIRYVMYTLVSANVLCLIFIVTYSLTIDSHGSTKSEFRFSILSITLLVLFWTTLSLWLAKWTRAVIVLAYLALASVLAFCYACSFAPIGYALALTGIALLYHGLNRISGSRLQPFGVLSLALDHIALLLVFIVPFISSPRLPEQLFSSVYNLNLDSSSLLYQVNWRTKAELVLVCLGIILTLSITFFRAGLVRNPPKASWCWLLLLGGFLLNWEYSIVTLALSIQPVWAFLGLALFLVAAAVIVRRLYSPAWANPLDVLALFGMIVTLSLSLNQNQDIISILLLSFAALIYAVSLYQNRHKLLFLPLIFALFAIPLLWIRPLAMLLLGITMPLTSVVIRRLITNRRNIAQTQKNISLSLIDIWEWPLLAVGLVYGIVASVHSITYDVSIAQFTFGMHIPIALEIALLAATWYVASALSKMKLWLVPSVGFAIGASFVPTNSFWVLLILTPVLALSGVAMSRFAGRDWSLPFYIIAVLSGVLTGYTGYTQDHLLAASWALIGFAAIAYSIGVMENTDLPMWILPAFAIWSLIISAGFLGDLYRPPIVALVCAALGISVRFFKLEPMPFFGSIRRNRFLTHSMPFYATALAAAILTGVYGTLADINRPFYGAVPDALLLYALVAFAVLVFEKQPVWLWMVAGFAIWGTSLALELTAYYLLAIGILIALFGLGIGLESKRFISKTSPSKSLQPLRQFTWSWPWYVTVSVAAVLMGFWTSPPFVQPEASFIGYSMLAFTIITLVIMFIERMPELLVFPAGLAAWAIWLWEKPASCLVPLMIAYSVLCLVIFAMQFTWRLIPPTSSWLPAAMPHVILGLGGQTIVVLSIIGQGGLTADSGQLVRVGAGALLELALMLFWFGRLLAGIVALANTSENNRVDKLKRSQQARAIQHWCYYVAGLLFSLVISWELSAFGQSRLDILLLVPAGYLTVVAPFVLRDEMLPKGHSVGQIIALSGAVLLLLPSLWFSFGDSNLFSTMVLIGESLALLLFGISTRIRTFILSSTALLIVGTLRALFLSTPPSIALMLLGVMLVVIATTLFLVRHKLKIAWTEWK